MKGIFVNQLSASGYKFAELIVDGYKTIETRSRNMLSACVGERVAIIKTVRGKRPTIVGYADLYKYEHSKLSAAECFELTLVPDGSKYANNRHFYYMNFAYPCDPYPLPANAVRHGRSWCEFEKEA